MPEAALAVEDDVGALALHEVGLHVVARLAAAGAAENQHVVVEPGGPGVCVGGVVAREEQLAGIGGAGVVAAGHAVLADAAVGAGAVGDVRVVHAAPF